MGKSESPPTPDFAGAAQQTAQGNLDAARYATQANRPNEITPYGTKTWTNNRTFDQAGYDAAMAKYQGGASGGIDLSGVAPEDRYMYEGQNAPSNPQGAAPDKNSFYGADNWTSTIALDPKVQSTLDKNFDLSSKYADIANTGLDKARSTLEDPTLDMTNIPDRAINQGQTAQEAIMARLNPQYQQQEEQLRTRLANQGVTAGSQAWDNDFRQFNQGRNDAQSQAALYGIGLDNQNRSSAIQEQAYLQDRPLNLINALRSGAQVQNPTFGGFANQATTAGPDYSGALGNTYSANVASQNVENKNSEQDMQGIAAIAAMMF